MLSSFWSKQVLELDALGRQNYCDGRLVVVDQW